MAPELITSPPITFRFPVNYLFAAVFTLPSIASLAIGLTALHSGDAVPAGIMLVFAACLILVSVFGWSRLLRLRRWSVTVGDEAIDVNLPAYRSPVEAMLAIHSRIPLASIDAIEMRAGSIQTHEKSLSVNSIGLQLKDGDFIVLGAEEPSEQTGRMGVLQATANEISRRTALPILMRDLPPSEVQIFNGKAGRHIAVGSDAIVLNLPKARNGGQDSGGRLRVPYLSIAAIDAGVEAGGWFKPADISYALKLKSGDVIQLGRSRDFDNDYAPFSMGTLGPNRLWAAMEALSNRSKSKSPSARLCPARKIPMICSSLNRERYIVRLLTGDAFYKNLEEFDGLRS